MDPVPWCGWSNFTIFEVHHYYSQNCAIAILQIFEIRHYVRLEIEGYYILLWAKLPHSDFSSLPHFTDVWDPHVSASSTSRCLCRRCTQGPDWREEAPRLAAGVELGVKLPQMLSLAKEAFPAVGIQAVKEELEREGRRRFPPLRRDSPALPATTSRRGRSSI
jgi:hypothetical protein